MTTMLDSVTATDIPASAGMIAGYVNGRYAWTKSDWHRFPLAHMVRISVDPHLDQGDALDVERGDSTPDQAPGWVTLRRKAGIDPVVYCSASAWAGVRNVFAARHVNDPHYWIADWTGQAHVPAGAVGCQYADSRQTGHHYDASLVTSHWPGLTPPAPAPAKPPAHRHTPYTVVHGDTLSKIGEEFGVPWRDIYAANRGVIGPDPDHIEPGEHLIIPHRHTPYTVVHGDTLSKIGEEFGVPWRDIYAANRGVIGPDPDHIEPGEHLIIP